MKLRGDKCPWSKLTERQVKLIMEDKDSKYKVLADKFEVSIYTIGSIKSGRAWEHITR
jgi:hypothetical protein